MSKRQMLFKHFFSQYSTEITFWGISGILPIHYAKKTVFLDVITLQFERGRSVITEDKISVLVGKIRGLSLFIPHLHHSVFFLDVPIVHESWH